MRDRPIRELLVEGDPFHRGAVHGAAYHNEIRNYSAERVRLSSNGSWAGRPATIDQVIDLANRLLPSHRSFDAGLYEEMEGLAAATRLSVAEVMIVGGFTDFVDTVRAEGVTGLPDEDDCTAVIVPDALSDGPGFLAQTWDMHDTATEHVTMLRVIEESGPGALVFTTVGCLGQIGMNEAGIAVGINNLSAANGKVGVTWPMVVRKILKQTSLDRALAVVLEADLAGGHNYLLFDREGTGYNIEAMPGYRAISTLGAASLVHTNHCLDPHAQGLEAPRPADLTESSVARLEMAVRLLTDSSASGPVGVDDLTSLTRESSVICRRSAPPHHTESSGAAIMRPGTGEMWACWGVPADNEFELFKI
ncbi:MAG TPA: C45 family peptidase [Acidimicrobiia bacterium]|jgi:isopenicillin-N N-acyltransferase-like protein